jgi:hypothetical protein
MKSLVPTFLLSVLLSLSVSSAQFRPDFVLTPNGQHPRIALDQNKNLHVVWRTVDPGTNVDNILHALLDSSGGVIHAPRSIISPLFGYSPRITTSSYTSFVVWESSSASMSTYIEGGMKSITADDTLSVVDRLNDPYSDAVRSDPDVASIDDSTFIAVWCGQGSASGQNDGVYAQIITSSHRRIGTNINVSDDLSFADRRGGTKVAGNQLFNECLVVWRQVTAGKNTIWGRLIDFHGTPLDSSFLVSDGPQLSDVWDVAVGTSASGEFMVVWSESIDTTWNIKMRTFLADGTAIDSVRQLGVAGSIYPSVDISVGTDGRIVVVWEQWNGSYSRLVAQRFLSDGVAIGGPFQLSPRSDTLGQIYPAVLLLDDKIFTAWEGIDTLWMNVLDFNNPQVSVDDPTPIAPGLFSLSQNYPNPFNSATTIHFYLHKQSDITLRVYDVLGREVVVLLDETRQVGSHAVSFDVSNLPSGVYFYRLQAGNSGETKNMMLMR